jgi:hypothetical protein
LLEFAIQRAQNEQEVVKALQFRKFSELPRITAAQVLNTNKQNSISVGTSHE